MALIRVTDPGDPRLRDYVSLTDVSLRVRHEPASGMYIAESAEVIRRAVEAGHRPRSMVMQDTWVDRLADLIEERRGRPIATVLISGYAPDEGLTERLRRPATAFVPKPFTREALASAVRDTMEAARTP